MGKISPFNWFGLPCLGCARLCVDWEICSALGQVCFFVHIILSFFHPPHCRHAMYWVDGSTASLLTVPKDLQGRLWKQPLASA